MKRSISLTGQAGVLDGGQRGLLRGASNAQCVDPGGPLLDPAPQHGDLVGGQVLAALLGRHLQIGVVALDPGDQLALIGLAGHDRQAAALELGEGALPWCRAAGRPCGPCRPGPWQAKQLSERIGRTSLAKPTGFGFEAPGASFESANPRAAQTPPRSTRTIATLRRDAIAAFPLTTVRDACSLAARPGSGRRALHHPISGAAWESGTGSAEWARGVVGAAVPSWRDGGPGDRDPIPGACRPALSGCTSCTRTPASSSPL